MPGSEAMTKGMLTRLDPPEHKALRHLVSAAFTPRRVAALEPRIRELTRSMLDGAGASFDLVDTLAFPLPVTVIAEMLGLPADDRPRFRGWAEGLFSMQVDDPKEAVVDPAVRDAMGEITSYLGDWCRARRADPTDDLISALVTAEVDGRRLDDEEAANFSMLLLLAGHITTTLLLGNAVRVIDENPGTWAGLRAEPSTIPAVIEEVLRLRPPFPMTARATTRDVEIAGTTVPARVDRHALAALGEPRPRRAPRPRALRPDARRHRRRLPARVRARHPLLPRRAAGPPRGARRARGDDVPVGWAVRGRGGATSVHGSCARDAAAAGGRDLIG